MMCITSFLTEGQELYTTLTKTAQCDLASMTCQHFHTLGDCERLPLSLAAKVKINGGSSTSFDVYASRNQQGDALGLAHGHSGRLPVNSLDIFNLLCRLHDSYLG